MIGRLRGVLALKKAPELLIDIGGIYYEVLAPLTTCCQLPPEGQTITLHTHFVVREDAQQLYGFYTLEERNLFRSLIRVNGVGPKLALSILSSIDANTFIACVQQKDHSRLTGIPGVGKKTAERLIMETQDILAQWTVTMSSSSTSPAVQPDAVEDALSALKTLGYKPHDARKAIEGAYKEHLSSEDLIRLALHSMTQGA